MRRRIYVLVTAIALICCGLLLPSVQQTSAQDEPDYEATIAALENRIDGLEARVELLEQQDASTTPGTTPTATAVSTTHTVNGMISLLSLRSGGSKHDGACNYSAEYKLHIDPGTVISVKDETGTVVGIGRAEEGTAEIGKKGSDGYTPLYCNIPFEIKDVPESDFYKISIEGVEGELTFSYQELEDLKWEVVITLH